MEVASCAQGTPEAFTAFGYADLIVPKWATAHRRTSRATQGEREIFRDCGELQETT